MRDGYQSQMLSTSLFMEGAARLLRRHPRKAAFAKFIFILLAMVLWLPILTLGQSQTQPIGQPPSAALTQSPTASQISTPKTSQTQSQASYASQPQLKSMMPPQETLADAAKRAKTQKPKSEYGKVFTDDDVSGLPGHGVSVIGDGLAGGSSSRKTEN
jgi:hypothetical protein